MIAVVCATCQRPMGAASCEPQRNALTWGSESAATLLSDRPCRDCGVAPGGYHHESCLVAVCRVCGDQWVMCEGEDHDPEESTGD